METGRRGDAAATTRIVRRNRVVRDGSNIRRGRGVLLLRFLLKRLEERRRGLLELDALDEVRRRSNDARVRDVQRPRGLGPVRPRLADLVVLLERVRLGQLGAGGLPEGLGRPAAAESNSKRRSPFFDNFGSVGVVALEVISARSTDADRTSLRITESKRHSTNGWNSCSTYLRRLVLKRNTHVEGRGGAATRLKRIIHVEGRGGAARPAERPRGEGTSRPPAAASLRVRFRGRTPPRAAAPPAARRTTRRGRRARA